MRSRNNAHGHATKCRDVKTKRAKQKPTPRLLAYAKTSCRGGGDLWEILENQWNIGIY